MEMQKAEEIARSVGLPGPREIELSDPSLVDTYREFCGGLVIREPGQAIGWDGEFWTLQDGIPESDDAKLKLLSAFIRPTTSYVAELNRRTHRIDDLDRQQGGFDGHLYKYGVAAGLKAFAGFVGTNDFRVLSAGCVPFGCLESLTAELATAPGVTWHSGLDVITFNEFWALVLFYKDAEERQEDAFPYPIGLIRADNLERSAGQLLIREPTFHADVGAKVVGNDLLAACWLRDYESDWSPGEELLSKSAEELAVLRRKYGSLSSRDLIKQLRLSPADEEI